MLALGPLLSAPRPPRLLFLGSHSDDIEIGCGGSILRLLSDYPRASISWAVFSGTPERAAEARASAADFLKGAERPSITLHDFPDAYFPSRFADIKKAFDPLRAFEPDVIFTHCGHDAHQDHRTLCELTWNTFRDHLILEYEVAKYDGDLRSPNLFVPLDEPLCRQKAALLKSHFGSQGTKPWFDEALFMGLMRIRGAECRSPSGYAEGFYARKIVF